MSTCTRTYLSTVTKNPVLMSTLRVPLSTFLNFNQIEKKIIVSQALPHLSFSDLKKVASSVFWEIKNINKKPFFIKVAYLFFLAIS